MASAIVAGATGAVGREVVVALVEDTRFERVVALSRRSLSPSDYETVFPGINPTLASSKLRVQAVDWEAATTNGPTPASGIGAEAFGGHQFAAMCMGTTRKDAGSAEAFRRVDVDYVQTFWTAVAAHSHSTDAGGKLRYVSQVSSKGASVTSYLTYFKAKGQSDATLVAMEALQGVPKGIYRPGLLGRNSKSRTVEKFFSWFTSPISVRTVARGITADWQTALDTASEPADDVQYLENSAIEKRAAAWTASSTNTPSTTKAGGAGEA